MPKKIVQHKGKTKHAVEESENTSYGKPPPENVQEQFEDNETKKFNKRPIENNWAKYNVSEVEPDDDESHETNDFEFLIQTASSDCSHFQFSSEKQWKNEDSLAPSSKIFNLDLNLLSKGLSCLPFYERIGLKSSELSEEDRKSFDKAAAKNLKDYNATLTKSETDDDVENKEQKTLDDAVVKKDLGEVNLKSDDEVSQLNKVTDKEDEQTLKQDNKSKSSQKDAFSESLEDWLDSVLDD